MRNIFTIAAFIILSTFCKAQVSFTFISDTQLTPTSNDTTGVFCRTFYHSTRDKFYVVYAGRPSNMPGPNQYFRWEEYDHNFNTTGVRGTLEGFTSGVGDYAMEMVGNSYYHLTGTGTGSAWRFRLSKYDQDFNLMDTVSFQLDSSDSKADMLFNYTNGKLIIGAFHQSGVLHPTMPMQTPMWQPYMHKWEYDTNLVETTPSVYLNEKFTTWGGSCIYNNDQYNIVTFDKFKGPFNPNYNLSVYRYDDNWNYIDSVALNNDGQWSQGVLWDGNYYFVAYHSGRTHRSGNITVGVYDANWSLIHDTVITNNAIFDTINNNPPLNITQYNANRPVLTKINDTLYVSYDQDDYIISDYGPAPFYMFSNNWQAHVAKLKINGIMGTENITEENQLNIFPNPASENIIINIPKNGTIQLTNLTGQIILTRNVNEGTIDLPIGEFPDGMYTISFRTDKLLMQQKIIIQ